MVEDQQKDLGEVPLGVVELKLKYGSNGGQPL